MQTPKIKICGMTQVDQTKLAIKLGVNYIGMIFYNQSPRHISIEQAQAICAILPEHVIPVGVFVNPSLKKINQVLQSVPLKLLQMHGNESEPFCQQLPLPYIKAIQVKAASELAFNPWFNSNAKAILVDTHSEQLHGGTGMHFDWHSKPNHLTKPIFLAGGITPDNILEAIKVFEPDVVDVNSGVEYAPGQKDPAKLKQLFKQLKQINYEQ